MKKIIYITYCILIFFSVPSQALEGREVMKKVLNAFYYQGKDQGAKAHMEITDQQGRQRTRDLALLRRNTNDGDGRQKYYVYFKGPSDIKKMAFMAWKNVTRDDDRWLYLPALDLVKRIAASDERTSFVGSHFFYEDVSGRSLEKDVHQLVDENKKYYIVKSKAKNPETVEFSSYQVWVDKKTFLPIKIEYYNSNNVMYRVYQTLKFDLIDGFPTITTAQMEDKISGGKTTIEYSSIRYSLGIPENVFSERYLRKAPKKYLK